MRYFMIVLSLITALGGCQPYSHQFMTGSTDEPSLEAWKGYGAVFEYDEMLVITDYIEGTHTIENTFTINRLIHILSEKGLKYATFKLDNVKGKSLLSLEITLVDSSGRNIPINLAEIEKGYSKTGYVVVPKVQVGSKIYVKAKLYSAGPVQFYDYSFVRSVPVDRAKFSFLYGKIFDYKCKAYGGLAPSESIDEKSLSGYTWSDKGIPPKSVFSNKGLYYDETPRALVDVERINLVSYDWNWNEIAKHIRQVVFNESIFTSSTDINRKTQELIEKAATDEQKADNILRYLQDNVSLSHTGLKNLRPDLVFKNKQGNAWEIAALAQKMFLSAGLKSRILVTCTRHNGGFDPDFPSLAYISLPLVEVVTSGNRQVAYFYSQGISIGEYPYFIYGLKALDVSNGTIDYLPEPKQRNLVLSSQVDLPLNELSEPVTWKLIYGHYLAMISRQFFLENGDQSKEGYFQRTIKSFDIGNRMNSVAITGQNRRGEEIVGVMKVANDTFVTAGNEAIHCSLSPFFRSFFTENNLSQSNRYRFSMEQHFDESINIIGAKKGKVKYDFFCSNIKNDLFEAYCAETQTDHGLKLSRRLVIKQCEITAKKAEELDHDIQELNRIKESFLIIKKQ